jgi:hypothetical protein
METVSFIKPQRVPSKKVQNKPRKAGVTGPKTLAQFVSPQIKTLQSISQVRAFREIYFPSATGMTVAGTGATYTAATGVLAVTTNDARFALFFRMTDTQNGSQFALVFDQYRIVEAKVRLHPWNSVSFWDNTDIVAEPPVFITPDFDDASVPATALVVMGYEGVLQYTPYKDIVLSLKPRMAIPSGTGFANVAAQWCDLNDLTIQHYGLKGVIMSSGVNHVINWTVSVEIMYEMRSSR